MGNCFTKKNNYPDFIDPKEIPKFYPNIREGKVINVYDGDTITIATYIKQNKMKKSLYKFSIRLRGIDCPEIKTHDENEKIVAELAKKYVKELCFNKVVVLHDIKYDKYGRILANVIINNQNISDLLLSKRLAVEYNGGKKFVPKNWVHYYETGFMD